MPAASVRGLELERITLRWSGGEESRALGSAGAAGAALEFALPASDFTWARAEIHGRAKGERCMIAFTNPAYSGRGI
jgi:hypothetical protein